VPRVTSFQITSVAIVLPAASSVMAVQPQLST
jgi:hypothetical protein